MRFPLCMFHKTGASAITQYRFHIIDTDNQANLLIIEVPVHAATQTAGESQLLV